jgi:hypothetical protein
MYHKPKDGSTIYFGDLDYSTVNHHLISVNDLDSVGGRLLTIDCIGEESCALCAKSNDLMKSHSPSDMKLGAALRRKTHMIFDVYTTLNDCMCGKNSAKYRMPTQIFRALSVMLFDEKIMGLMEHSEKPLSLRFVEKKFHGFPTYDNCYFVVGNDRHLPVKYLNGFEQYRRNVSLADAKRYYECNILEEITS